MIKYYHSFCLLLIVIIFANPQKAYSQYDFQVYPCSDSSEVVSLFDSVFFRQVPPETITNLSFYGDPNSVGYYVSATFLGFESSQGIILTTGFANDGDNSNICNSSANASSNNNGVVSDPDLNLLSNGNNSYDGCIIEFDFKPTTDFIHFNYVFASEEYHEYVFASFNDAFGVLLSGAGISGPYSNDAKNIALIPGTNLNVSINNINLGEGGNTCSGPPGGCTNCQWFKDNSQDYNPAFDKLVYDGLTKAIVAKDQLQHGNWYHIKLVIGDIGDAAFDSALFLEKGSFNSGSITPVTGPKRMD